MAISEHRILSTSNYNSFKNLNSVKTERTVCLEYRQEQYRIQLCKSPKEALVSIQQELPHCILWDWELNDNDRNSMLHQFHDYQVPIIILVERRHEEAVSLVSTEYQDYLVKETLTPELLGTTLRNAIAQFQLKQELTATTNKLQNSLETNLLEIQNRYLGCIAMGDPLEETLNLLSQLIEFQLKNTFCAIVIIDTQNCLQCISAPNLPKELSCAIDGISLKEITPIFGKTFQGKRIDISELTNHHLQTYQHLLQSHGFTNLWINSIPTRDTKKVLGFFILYYRDASHPLTEEIKVVRNTAYAAGIAIERNHSEIKLQQQLHREQVLYQQLQQELSDRQKAEQTLRENQRFIQSITDASPNIIFLYNVQKQINVYANQATYSILGYTPQEVQAIGVEFLPNLLHPEDFAKFSANVALLNKAVDGEIIDIEYRIRHANGEWRWLYSRDSVFSRDEDGQVLLTIGAAQDITDRKRAEEALQRSEAHQRALISAIPDLIMRINREGTYLEFLASPKFHILGNNNVADLVGLNIFQILSHDLAQQRINYIHQALDTNSIQIYEQSFPVNDRIQFEEVRIVPYTEDEVLLLVRDISDYKLTEERLRQSEKRFERIALSLPGFIYTAIIRPDGSHHFEYISSGVEKISEVTVEQVLQDPKCLDEQHHPDDHADFAAAANYSVATMTAFNHEWRMITPSGEIKWLQVSSLPEKIDQDNIFIDLRNGAIARHGIVLDITARKTAELQVIQQADQQKLLASISQHIRSSLNLEEILNTTVAEIHQVLKSDRVLVYQIFANGTGAAIAESVSPSYPSVLNNTYSEEVFPQEIHEQYLNGRVYILNDRDNEPVLDCLVEFLHELKVRAKLAVPIIQDKKLWGLLIVHQCDRPYQWQEWEIDLMQQLSSQFVIAIQQASLYEQLQLELRDRQRAEQLVRQQADREALLREIMQRIRQSLDLNKIFDTATLEIRQFFHADRVVIFKFDAPNSNTTSGKFIAESVIAGYQSLLQFTMDDHYFCATFTQACRQGSFVAFHDIYNSDLSDYHINLLTELQIKANLAVPLLNGNTLWGIICIHQCSSPRHWETIEISLVQQISNQLGIALQQAFLYQQVQTELADKEKLYVQLANELHQKKVLLKEVHHRVKNNLQVMSSLLRMQFRKTSPELKILIEEYQNRIQSMALIHAQLHRNDDLENINFCDYLTDLTTNLFQCYGNSSASIECNLEVNNIFLSLDQSIPLGLIINELVSNSLKHAFPSGNGEINIQLICTDNHCHLKVADSGIGIPSDFDLENTDSLGMQLVHSLTEQLEGELQYSGYEGSVFQITFPRQTT